LLATDLDGTVIGGVQEFPLYADFRRALMWLRESEGGLWVACTGRSLSSFTGFSMPLRRMDITPDYVIVRHAYIFSRSRFCWWPHVLWNMHIRHHAWVDRRAAQQALSEWHRTIVGCSLGVRTRRRDEDRLVLHFESDSSANEALTILKRDFPLCKHIQVTCAGNEVKAQLVPFTKGLALTELARYIGVPMENVLAIGNGHNDISMLDGTAAGMTGCPSNSEVEVMDAVHVSGGHIAGRPSLGGVLEVIEAYRSGTVTSALPEKWNTAPRHDKLGQPHRSKKHKRAGLRVYIILGVVGYIVMLVFANFGLLPFSSLIMKPVTLVGKIIQKIMQ
jgi:hydroxymethylpyrimidine pyrophosphatase-like HAD family hydrolase